MLAPRALLERLALRVPQGLPALLVQPGRLAQLALKALREQPEPPAQLARLDLLDLLDPRGRPARKAPLATGDVIQNFESARLCTGHLHCGIGAAVFWRPSYATLELAVPP